MGGQDSGSRATGSRLKFLHCSLVLARGDDRPSPWGLEVKHAPPLQVSSVWEKWDIFRRQGLGSRRLYFHF